MTSRLHQYEAEEPEELAALIKDAIDVSLEDPETRKLAGSLASGSCDWITDPRSGQRVAAVKYHRRWYRVAAPGQEPIRVCRSRDDQCAIINIWNFAVLNIRYTDDMDMADTYQDLRTTLETGVGDCDDYTTVFCALFRALGYQCAARIISVDGHAWQHVYPMVRLPTGKWMALDATEMGNGPGWQYPHIAARIDFDMGEGDDE